VCAVVRKIVFELGSSQSSQIAVELLVKSWSSLLNLKMQVLGFCWEMWGWQLLWEVLLLRALQCVSGGFHLELEMTEEPGTKGFCSRQSITQKTTRIKAKVCWKKYWKMGFSLRTLSLYLSLSTKPWRQTIKQPCCCKQTNKQRNQHKKWSSISNNAA
jgi:hypothetical protein